jgi:predicted DNA-binding transcriptional regulator AlpA
MNIMRKKAVLDLFCIGNSTLFNMMNNELIPRSFKLGLKISAWDEADLNYTLKLYKSGMTTQQIQAEIRNINNNNCSLFLTK